MELVNKSLALLASRRPLGRQLGKRALHAALVPTPRVEQPASSPAQVGWRGLEFRVNSQVVKFTFVKCSNSIIS